MLDVLQRALEDLPRLVFDSDVEWHTLGVRYETPHVNRVWMQWEDDYRLNLHEIFPCDQPLYHPHPWASAVAVMDGYQEMGVGIQENGVFKTVATTVLGPRSRYEMIVPWACHYVRPLGGPSMSVMVTAKPWRDTGLVQPGKGFVHPPLYDRERDHILNFFRSLPTATYLK